MCWCADAQFLEKEQTTDHGAQCSCSPSLSEAELNDFVRVWNPHYLLNAAKGPDAKAPSKCGLSGLAGDGAPVVDLGSTCSYETFSTKGQCVMQAK